MLTDAPRSKPRNSRVEVLAAGPPWVVELVATMMARRKRWLRESYEMVVAEVGTVAARVCSHADRAAIRRRGAGHPAADRYGLSDSTLAAAPTGSRHMLESSRKLPASWEPDNYGCLPTGRGTRDGTIDRTWGDALRHRLAAAMREGLRATPVRSRSRRGST